MRKLLKIVGYAGGTLFGVSLLALLVLSLPQSGWRALSVQTGSMVPTFDPGALVLVHKVPANSLQKGDIITYKSHTANQTITHRIVGFQNSNQQRLIITKGDANQAADTPVTGSQVAGKEIKSIPYAGHVVDFVRQPLGLMLLIYLPAVLMIIYEIKIMTERLAQLEIQRRRAVAKVTAQKIYGGTNPRKHSPATGKGLMALVCLVFLGAATSPAYAQLTSNEARLAGTTIRTKAVQVPGGSNGSCSSSTNVTINNSSNVTASSGNATSNNGGQATSGNANASASTNFNVNVNSGC